MTILSIVIPAKAGIQLRLTVACKLDPDFRRGDDGGSVGGEQNDDKRVCTVAEKNRLCSRFVLDGLYAEW